MNDNFLRDLFNNPDDGTFLAWLADRGLWALLIVLGAILTWYIVRRYISSRLIDAERRVAGADDVEIGSDSAAAGINRLISSAIPAAVIGTAAVIGVMVVLGNDVDPAIDFFQDLGTDAARWLLTGGVTIVVVIVLAWVGLKLTRRLIPPLMLRLIRDSRDAADAAEASRKRAETLGAVFVAAADVIIVVVVVFTVLTELGVPVGPVLGGVGIAGIAIGFGAQHLVRDVITGTLILLENQYRQGDVVEIAGIAGMVESINLRRTVLRDLNGKVHTIPHGEISTTTNFTKYWSRIVLDVGVAYKEDLDRVFPILDELGMELANHPELGLKVIDPPKVLRLNAFGPSELTIRMLGVCKPLTQWELTGWLRRRVKERFDEEGIEIPFPHQTLYWGVDQPQLSGLSAASAVEEAATVQPAGLSEPEPEVSPDDFVEPGELTPEQREAMLAEMALAAQAAQQQLRPDGSDESRLPSDAE